MKLVHPPGPSERPCALCHRPEPPAELIAASQVITGRERGWVCVTCALNRAYLGLSPNSSDLAAAILVEGAMI